MLTLDVFGKAFYEAMGPFFMVFVIVTGLLNKIKIWKERKYDTVIGVCMGLLVIFPHILGTRPDVVPIINIMIPSVVLIMVITICLLLMLALVGVKYSKGLFTKIFGVLIFVDLIIPDTILLAVLAKNFGVVLPPWLEFLTTDTFLAFAIVISVFLAAIFFVTWDKKSDK
ncbi:hypothetical protein GOV11_02565 [Candidatus Woesearchaeota archaeon]|nr:hypothetical protein [Candidatus Woesearchaeota archaeon]